jgi:hypothetical protein
VTAWELIRDLIVVGLLLIGYAWLSVLSTRQQALAQRLALHICRQPRPRSSRPTPDRATGMADPSGWPT